MTERLYYTDSHIASFEAEVLSCEQAGESWALILSRTAFFPGGGGQAADEGSIDGVEVLSVCERDGNILHLMPRSFAPGSVIRGEINYALRFSRMQAHSGEHILSGTVHRRFGYDNVGFHMGAEGMVIDFSGELPQEALPDIELEANRAVWADLPIRCFYPEAQELETLPFRSKKELEGAVRLVEIPGVDLCACCAPHVQRTGEIGLIRIIDAARVRGGTRLTLLAGEAAYLDCAALHSNSARLSALLSAPRLTSAEAAERVLREREAMHAELGELRRELVRLKAEALPNTEGCLCVFEPEMDSVSLRELVNAGMRKSALCAGFSGRDGDWLYVIGSRGVNLRALAPEINSGIKGRGGGSPEMLQGRSQANREELEAFFSSFLD